MERIFRPADILLPDHCDMKQWSVVACDQFTSQREYWDALDVAVGTAPSTLRLMLPEAYLETRDPFAEAEKINAVMREYLDRGVFRTLENSFVYVERTLADGSVRRGVVGMLDLDGYDFSADSVSPIRATEGTVTDRLPPRVRIRRGAPLEMPHIMVFVDDDRFEVIDSLTGKKDALPVLYDFDLSCGGGHICGRAVSGEDAESFSRMVDRLSDAEALSGKYGSAAPAIFAMGDGNHSLATAKKCWEEIKPTLSEAERRAHPARFSLVEIVNIHDEAIRFEPIHRALFDTDAGDFIREAEAFFAADPGSGTNEHSITLITAGGEKTITVRGNTIGQLIGKAESFCCGYIAAHGGKIDYIHNDDTASEMGRHNGCASLLLPKMEKSELFPSIIRSGPFPKKSFSIGHAEDKRYYLECRKIK